MEGPEREIRRQQKNLRKEFLSKEKGDTYIFSLMEDFSMAEDTVSRLNRALEGSGVSFSVERYAGLTELKVTVKENQVKNLKTRYAGRPKEDLYVEEDGIRRKVTVNRVRALIRKEGAVKAAKKLGLSKAGMYKRLRAAREAAQPCSPLDDPTGEGDLRF